MKWSLALAATLAVAVLAAEPAAAQSRGSRGSRGSSGSRGSFGSRVSPPSVRWSAPRVPASPHWSRSPSAPRTYGSPRSSPSSRHHTHHTHGHRPTSYGHTHRYGYAPRIRTTFTPPRVLVRTPYYTYYAPDRVVVVDCDPRPLVVGAPTPRPATREELEAAARREAELAELQALEQDAARRTAPTEPEAEEPARPAPELGATHAGRPGPDSPVAHLAAQLHACLETDDLERAAALAAHAETPAQERLLQETLFERFPSPLTIERATDRLRASERRSSDPGRATLLRVLGGAAGPPRVQPEPSSSPATSSDRG